MYELPQSNTWWCCCLLQLLDWGPFDLVIGGSPCNDLSIVNPARKGLYGENLPVVLIMLENYGFADEPWLRLTEYFIISLSGRKWRCILIYVNDVTE